MKHLFLAVLLVFSFLKAQAKPFDFTNIRCHLNDRSSHGARTYIEISYDPNTNSHFGRPGTIFLKMNTGSRGLSSLGSRLGLESEFYADIRLEGVAGQLSSFLGQVHSDKFVLNGKIGFERMKVTDRNGKTSIHKSFINSFSLTRILEKRFSRRGKAEEVEFIEFQLLNDFGTFRQRFVPEDCTTF